MADSFSRRHFCGLGAASLAFAPSLLHAAPDETLAARDLADRLTIDAYIGGKGPFRFVVDTGADRTVIANELAADLALPRGAPMLVQGIARAVTAPSAVLENLSLGNIAADRLVTPTLPRAWIGADGYLGLDVLNRHRVTFDFAGRELQLHEPRPAMFGETARPNEIVLRTSGDLGHLRAVDCRVDGVRASAFLDTGAEVSVGNPRLQQELAKRGAQYEARDPVELTGITGGAIIGRIMPVERLWLPGVDINDSGFVIADLQIFRVWDLAERPALFIGMDMLRRFGMVTIDYTRQEYRLRFANLTVAQNLI